MWIKKLELELTRSKDDVIYLKRDNLALLKQGNIFFFIANRLYFNFTQLHLDCEIGKNIHKMILPFLELKDDKIDAECYRCESIVSSDDVSDSYKVGLNKIEAYIQSKEHKDMLKQILNEKDKEQIKFDTVQKFDSLCTKLSSENTFDTKNVFEFDESDISEISIDDEVDWSEL